MEKKSALGVVLLRFQVDPVGPVERFWRFLVLQAGSGRWRSSSTRMRMTETSRASGPESAACCWSSACNSITACWRPGSSCREPPGHWGAPPSRWGRTSTRSSFKTETFISEQNNTNIYIEFNIKVNSNVFLPLDGAVASLVIPGPGSVQWFWFWSVSVKTASVKAHLWWCVHSQSETSATFCSEIRNLLENKIIW